MTPSITFPNRSMMPQKSNTTPSSSSSQSHFGSIPSSASSHNKRKRDVAFGGEPEAMHYHSSSKEGRATKQQKRCMLHGDEDIQIDGRRVILEDYLGRGEYGHVYLAKRGPEKLAVKFFKESAKKYFLNECQCLIRVRHTSHRIVNLVGFGTIPNSREMFMAFEYIGSTDLRSLIRNYSESDVPFIKKSEIMLELLYALSEIHHSKICHHDIKPDNILLSDGGLKPIICDFGMASYQNCSFREQPKGTLIYMAPEAQQQSLKEHHHHHHHHYHHHHQQQENRQNANEQQISMSFSSDVWSLGVVFYELITHGMLPYEGRKNETDFSHHIMEDEPQPFPHRLEKTVPHVWQHIIFDMMLVRDPKKRASVHKIINYLNAHKVSLLTVAASHQKTLNSMRETLCKKEKELVESQFERQLRGCGGNGSSNSDKSSSITTRDRRHQDHNQDVIHLHNDTATTYHSDQDEHPLRSGDSNSSSRNHTNRSVSMYTQPSNNGGVSYHPSQQNTTQTQHRQSRHMSAEELLDSFHDIPQRQSSLDSYQERNIQRRESHSVRRCTQSKKVRSQQVHSAAFGSHDEPRQRSSVSTTRAAQNATSQTLGQHDINNRGGGSLQHTDSRFSGQIQFKTREVRVASQGAGSSSSVDTPSDDTIDDLIINSLIQQNSGLSVA
eukprot:CAMPEP_0117448090 /NCGR_PEP_ID=MMETSP0759-20121206/7216_1 /TAXON_ID=63605 /ORGANISM="Percolomonas cosmopolitus, Strain WS" /LENGTH=665 /DNA_ID=CAMNT_0005240455 /DNA_START=9 /DNA_END=2006 /DNA_ORIENTATION=-